MEQSSAQGATQTGNNSQSKLQKDPNFPPTSPQSFNFQSYNLNILVQQYNDKTNHEDPQKKVDQNQIKSDQLSQIQEDNSENTPQTINSNSPGKVGDIQQVAESSSDANNIEQEIVSDSINIIEGNQNHNSRFGILGSNTFHAIGSSAYNISHNGDLYDQRLGAMKRGKLFTLQDLESFGGKEKSEIDEIMPLTEELIDHRSLGWGSGKDISLKNPLSVSQQLLTLKEQYLAQKIFNQQPLPKKTILQSKASKIHQVTIRTPDIIWKQKIFFIICYITRMVNKMKQINIFRHPEQLYFTQLNAINDKGAKDITDQNWGLKDVHPQHISIPTLAELQARKKYKYYISRYRLLRKKIRKIQRPIINKIEVIILSIKRKILAIGEKVNPFDSLSWFIQIWWNSVFLISLSVIIYLPYQYCFNVERDRITTKIFNYLLPFIFILNMLINTNTSFFEKGNVINDRIQIIWNYSKTNLLIDFLSTISLFADSFSQFTFLFYLRIYLYKDFVSKQTERFLLHQSFYAITQLLSLLCMILLSCHFISCLWYLLGNYLETTQNSGWLYEAKKDTSFSINNSSSLDVYLVSYLEVISNITLIQNSSSITYSTREERLFLLALGVVGICIIAFVLHEVQKILSEIDKTRVQYLRQLKQLSIYLRSHEVEPDLRERSRKYLEFMYIKKQDSQGNTQECLNSLSNYLKQEIIKDVFLKAVKKVGLFRRFFSFNPKFLEKLALKSIEVSYGPDELIMRQGTTDTPQLYLVTQGEIQLFVETGSRANIQQKIFKIIKKNECFGMYEFFSSNCEVQLSAKSIGVSRISSIKLDDMRELLQEFPKEREAFCYLKDSITFKSDYSQIGLNCFSCKQVNHYALECPYLFYGTQSQNIMKEINKRIKLIIATFKRSIKRKKQNSMSKYLLVSKMAEKFIEQNLNEIQISEEVDIEGSSDTSVQFQGQSSNYSSESNFDNHNQSKFERDKKSILRVHSGSSKFTSKPRHKDSDSKEPSSRDDSRGHRVSVNISKFGRLIKVQDGIPQDEVSEFKNSQSWNARDRPISLSNNYEINTVGRGSSAEFLNQDDSKRFHSAFKRSESEQQLSYDNILDRGEYGQEEEIQGDQSQQRSQQRHSTHQTNKTNKTNRTNKTSKTLGVFQIEGENPTHPSLNSLQKSSSGIQEAGIEIEKANVNQFNNSKANLLENNPTISPIVNPRKESYNSNSLNNNSSNMLIQLLNPNVPNVNSSTNNNLPSGQSQPPIHSSFISQVLAQFNQIMMNNPNNTNSNNANISNSNNNQMNTNSNSYNNPLSNNNNNINNNNNMNNNNNSNSNSNMPSSSSHNGNLDKLIGAIAMQNQSNPNASFKDMNSNLNNNNNNNNNNISSSLVNNIPNSSYSNTMPTNLNYNQNIPNLANNNNNNNNQAFINPVQQGSNIPTIVTNNSIPDRYSIHQNTNSIHTNNNTLTQKQNSGPLFQQRSQSFSQSQRFNQQQPLHYNQQENKFNPGQRGPLIIDSYSASIGTMKSFELYFPQNNIENIIEKYNKLQRKRVSRRVKKKSNTVKVKDLQKKKHHHFTAFIEPKQTIESSHLHQQQQSLPNLESVGTKPLNSSPIGSLANSNLPISKKANPPVKKDIFSLNAFNINESEKVPQRKPSLKVKS